MKNLLVALSLLLCLPLFSQDFKTCGDALVKHQLEKKYPGVSKIINQTFEEAKDNASSRAVVLRIPVVFHVVYNNDDQNLSDELLRSQIDVLNEDFRRLNSNASETRDMFLPIAADAEIEFFLAGEDPQGNQSSGITRTFTDLTTFINISISDLVEAFGECGTDFNDPDVLACFDEFFANSEAIDLDAMKSSETGGKDAWDPSRYLNIWVANLGLDAMGGDPIPFILGFAYPPMEAPNWPEDVFPDELEKKDGVVLHYQIVGRDNPFSGALAGLNDQGRTCVHEVGHYLGLRHIWGDGDCTMDDGISDTPAAASDSQATTDVNSCIDFHDKDSCSDDSFPDMVENYMDYSSESCQNMFTNEQVALMRSMLEGPRSGLLENQVSSIYEPKEEFSVFPNPTTGLISIMSDKNSDLQINVFDSKGRFILSTSSSQFEIPAHSSGIYFLEIKSSNISSFKKIVLSK